MTDYPASLGVRPITPVSPPCSDTALKICIDNTLDPGWCVRCGRELPPPKQPNTPTQHTPDRWWRR